uniref:Uncharacterized protein n=1 Tax=Megaviridae environmental sample TaxID=1737588 RepID=A0A5J6VKG8_9VIRU|nr:MAG: hypothetical protein [Megaviridae environmental sample]
MNVEKFCVLLLLILNGVSRVARINHRMLIACPLYAIGYYGERHLPRKLINGYLTCINGIFLKNQIKNKHLLTPINKNNIPHLIIYNNGAFLDHVVLRNLLKISYRFIKVKYTQGQTLMGLKYHNIDSPHENMFYHICESLKTTTCVINNASDCLKIAIEAAEFTRTPILLIIHNAKYFIRKQIKYIHVIVEIPNSLSIQGIQEQIKTCLSDLDNLYLDNKIKHKFEI